MNSIEAVIFDLGETLLNFGKLNTSKVFREAGRISYEFLRQAHQPVGAERWYTFSNLLLLRCRALWSDITGNDFDSLELLKKIGNSRGYDLTAEQWRQVNWLWYEPLSKRAVVEADLAETLTKLKDARIKLAILSNTFVNKDAIEKHLAAVGVLDFFCVRMYSYQFKFRKPDKRIFTEAARQLGVDPASVIYVGDRIDKDVKGSMAAQMTPVLKTAYTNANKHCPQGVIKIQNISELPALIARINRPSQ